MSISVEFQNRFLDLISDENLKHTAIAKKIGIGAEIFAKAANYGIVPTPKVLMRIAEYFNTSIEYLLARTDDEYFSKSKQKDISFHDRLDELKNSQNLTYYELSKMIHIDRNYFSDWKTKKYIPSLENLILIADFFKVSIDYLLGRTDDK